MATTPNEQQQIRSLVTPTIGCDPEIFISKGGEIIGAEKAIPADGLPCPSAADETYRLTNKRAAIVLDGVQAELNPKPSHCRALLATEISAAFVTLRKHLKKSKMEVCFKQVVEVDSKELDSLSDKAKILGCAPSENIYNTSATLGIDPATYRKRSAGGHIHLGFSNWKQLFEQRHRLVVLMDILVGNTSVLIDRDPGNAERRQVYGRAGEHRLPAHGLEYRTLSNFWLRAYPLASMVWGMSRLAVNVLANEIYGQKHDPVNAYAYLGGSFAKQPPLMQGPGCWKDAESTLLGMVDIEKVQKAINTNDATLAKENWTIVSRYLRDHSGYIGYGLHGDYGPHGNLSNVEDFDYFVQMLDKKGIEYWFPHDPLIAWTDKFGRPQGGIDNASGSAAETFGWETFLSHVKQERLGVEQYKAA